jgi:type III pantothenate kinase
MDDPDLGSYLASLCPVLQVSGITPSPLRSTYASPLTLGADRLANSVGALVHLPGRPVLAIDAGTCITYDLIEKDGTYMGGAISPGLRMRAKALHAYSARLPMVDPGPRPASLGNDTRSSIAAGMHHGILGEVQGFIRDYAHDRPDLAVVLTGGDALWIAAGLKNGIFAHPLLTLDGLHAILVHNLPLHRATDGAAAQAHGGPGTAG